MQKFRLADGTELIGRAALSDTMEDFIVDALSALAASVIGYLSIKGRAKAAAKSAPQGYPPLGLHPADGVVEMSRAVYRVGKLLHRTCQCESILVKTGHTFCEAVGILIFIQRYSKEGTTPSAPHPGGGSASGAASIPAR